VRVLLVADFYPPTPGGLEAHVQRLARELVHTGHEVHVAAGGNPATPLDEDGIAVHRVDLSVPLVYAEPGRAFHPPWPDQEFGQLVANLTRDFDPHVIHAHGWCSFSAAAAAASHRPLVVTLHDYGLCCPKKSLLRGEGECAAGRGLRCVRCAGPEQNALKRIVLSAALARTVPALTARVTRFIAVSQHVARRHESLGLADKLQVIPNFIDLPPEPYTEPAGDGVLFVGPPDRHKGLPVLLRARRQFPPRTRTVVVGTNPPAGGDQPDIEYCGRLSGAALRARYRAAAVVVVPPIWPDPCPTVVLEAFAAGRPVVGSRAGGITDLVVDGHTGMLVAPGDARALSTAVSILFADRAKLAMMARGAFARAKEFATPAVVRRIVSVYDDALVGLR
jgi:glycosyltransferase involved in cell wall biosynthesis